MPIALTGSRRQNWPPTHAIMGILMRAAMVDDADLIERTEIEFWKVIELAHRRGLPYKKILELLPDMMTDLEIKSEAENSLNQKNQKEE